MSGVYFEVVWDMSIFFLNLYSDTGKSIKSNAKLEKLRLLI